MGGNLKVGLNVFDNYTVNVMRPPNIETGEPEPNMIAGEYQYRRVSAQDFLFALVLWYVEKTLY